MAGRHVDCDVDEQVPITVQMKPSERLTHLDPLDRPSSCDRCVRELVASGGHIGSPPYTGKVTVLPGVRRET